MNWIDITLLALTGYLLIQGWRAGIVKTVFRYLSIISGLTAALGYHPFMNRRLNDLGVSLPDPWLTILSFILLFILTAAVVQFIGYIISKLLKPTPLGPIDRILGASLGLLKSLLLCIIATYLLSLAPESVSKIAPVSNSVILREFRVILPWMERFLGKHKSKIMQTQTLLKKHSGLAEKATSP